METIIVRIGRNPTIPATKSLGYYTNYSRWHVNSRSEAHITGILGSVVLCIFEVQAEEPIIELVNSKWILWQPMCSLRGTRWEREKQFDQRPWLTRLRGATHCGRRQEEYVAKNKT